MNNLQLVFRMLSSGRILKRASIAARYAYYLGLEKLNPAWSLERATFTPASRSMPSPTEDRTDSIELHLVADENARREFDQPDEPRRATVTNIPDKFRTSSCFICSSLLTPVIQIVNGENDADFIELSWCSTCDHLQYSVMPRKSWITGWYAANWDTGGSIADKLDTRRKTYRYFHRLEPYIGGRKLKVLDIGAGYGEKIQAFQEAGHEVHCTEATTRRADYLRQHVTPNVHLGTLDEPAVRDALRRSGPFDLIFTYHVVEHIYDARAELQILRDIAAPNAIFYLAIPELYKEGIFNNIYALEHMSSFSRRSAKTLMERIGFDTITDKDDLFQYFSNYCQYLVGRKAADAPIEVPANPDAEKFARYLSEALRFDRLAVLQGSTFTYGYHGHAPLTYAVSEESKAKCRNPSAHLPLRIYHHGLPLFWMAS
jgi:2-polyprenyl-3-methyl-5-hydroxy-6-metoxy-1,4-benzoquinol methylase